MTAGGLPQLLIAVGGQDGADGVVDGGEHGLHRGVVHGVGAVDAQPGAMLLRRACTPARNPPAAPPFPLTRAAGSPNIRLWPR